MNNYRRLPYTYSFLTIRRPRNSEWHEWDEENSINKVHYIKPHIEECKGPTTVVDKMRLN